MRETGIPYLGGDHADRQIGVLQQILRHGNAAIGNEILDIHAGFFFKQSCEILRIQMNMIGYGFDGDVLIVVLCDVVLGVGHIVVLFFPGGYGGLGGIDEEIKHFLSGNLCRCTGYMGQMRAVRNYMEMEAVR